MNFTVVAIFRERDQQLARVVPVMRRFLPGHLLMAVGDAMQLQAVSLEFDLDLAEILVDCPNLTQPDYARAYREHDAWTARDEQMTLINALGELLDETVHKPMVHRLVQMMQVPAALAGFGALQSFLRRGLDAFARMDGADHFLKTIDTRERQALAAMQTGQRLALRALDRSLAGELGDPRRAIRQHHFPLTVGWMDCPWIAQRQEKSLSWNSTRLERIRSAGSKPGSEASNTEGTAMTVMPARRPASTPAGASSEDQALTGFDAQLSGRC